MLKIRLKKMGRSKQPSYRVVVMESSQPRDGIAIDEIGLYSPRSNKDVFTVDKQKAEEWLRKGAQPTGTVAQFFVKEGLLKQLERGSTKPTGKKKTKEAQ